MFSYNLEYIKFYTDLYKSPAGLFLVQTVIL